MVLKNNLPFSDTVFCNYAEFVNDQAGLQYEAYQENKYNDKMKI
jgi:hypothetical protein